MAFSDLLIKKQPSTKPRDEEKRRMVLAIEANNIYKKIDPSRFINVSTRQPLGVKVGESITDLIRAIPELQEAD